MFLCTLFRLGLVVVAGERRDVVRGDTGQLPICSGEVTCPCGGRETLPKTQKQLRKTTQLKTTRTKNRCY